MSKSMMDLRTDTRKLSAREKKTFLFFRIDYRFSFAFFRCLIIACTRNLCRYRLIYSKRNNNNKNIQQNGEKFILQTAEYQNAHTRLDH